MSTDSSQPNPQPQPIPVSHFAIPSWLHGCLSTLVGPVLVAGTLIGYDQFFRKHPEPYRAPLAATAKQYRDTLGDAYHLTSEKVASSILTDKAGVVDALKAHAKPLAAALDAAFAPLIDEGTGKITNPSAASDVLEQVAKALGGKS